MCELETLDTRGLLCPLPVIRTQDFIKKRKSVGSIAGLQLVVLASDPGALQDIPAWCRIHGHQVLGVHEQQTGVGGPEIQVHIELRDS